MAKKLHTTSPEEIIAELAQKSISPEGAALVLTPFFKQIESIIDDVKNMTDLTSAEVRGRLLNALKRSASSLEIETVRNNNIQNILYRDLQEASSRLGVSRQLKISKYTLPKEKTKDDIESELALKRKLNANRARVIRSTRGLT